MFFSKEGERRVVASINEVIKLLVEISLSGFKEREEMYKRRKMGEYGERYGTNGVLSL